MRWNLALVPVFLLMQICAARAEAPNLRIAIEGDYPPFSQRNAAGELVGFDVDIAMALCQEIKAKCELVQQNWQGMIPGLLARKFDLIVASMAITEERQKKVDFTRKYWNAPSRFVAQEGRFTSDNPDAMAGLLIGVQGGSIQDRYVTAIYKTAQILRYQNQEEIYLDLIAGRLDATLVAAFQADLNFLKTKEGKGFAFFGKDHSDPVFFGEGAGIALRKGEDGLREKLNAALKTIRADGTYQEINARYTDVDIYGE